VGFGSLLVRSWTLEDAGSSLESVVHNNGKGTGDVEENFDRENKIVGRQYFGASMSSQSDDGFQPKPETFTSKCNHGAM